MGTCASDAVHTGRDLGCYWEKTQLGLDALARMLAGNCFSVGPEQMRGLGLAELDPTVRPDHETSSGPRDRAADDEN